MTDACNYNAYGTTIQSALSLPALLPATESADVIIRFGQITFPSTSIVVENTFAISVTPDAIYLHWQDIGKFLVRAGQEIVIEAAASVTDDMLRLYIMGTTFAMLLHQRGLMVLHASAVAVNGEAVIFMGDKGYGKSTTAAAMYTHGHPLIADDLVAIDLQTSLTPQVMPGYPMFKLWPESVQSLNWDSQSLPRLRADVEKLGRDARDTFTPDPLPLKCIYVLAGGAHLHSETFNRQAAFFHILSGLYVSRFPAAFRDSKTAAENFRRASKLAQYVPVRGLLRPQDLSTVPQLARFIEADLCSLRSPSASPTPL